MNKTYSPFVQLGVVSCSSERRSTPKISGENFVLPNLTEKDIISIKDRRNNCHSDEELDDFIMVDIPLEVCYNNQIILYSAENIYINILEFKNHLHIRQPLLKFPKPPHLSEMLVRL
jgi:hypothetical protein